MSGAPPSDIETGVSNGDVDWLFRGKSKKLEKKLNSERRPSVSLAVDAERADKVETQVENEKEACSRVNTGNSGSISDQKPNCGSQIGSEPGTISRSNSSSKLNPGSKLTASLKVSGTMSPKISPISPQISVAKAQHPRQKAQVDHTFVANTESGDNSEAKSRTFKTEESFDVHSGLIREDAERLNVGRYRSSSAPQLPKQPTVNPTQLQSALKRSSSTSSKNSSDSAPSAPCASSQAQSRDSIGQQAAVSRSNSGKGRSFFSSLSSKFKSSSFSAPSIPGQTSQSGSKYAQAAPPVSSSELSSLNSPRSPMDHNQDLVSVKKPPSEIGNSIGSASIAVPVKTRRPSLSSLTSMSPRSSVDKERGGFFKRKSMTSEAANTSVSSPKSDPKTRRSYEKSLTKESLQSSPVKDKKPGHLHRVSFALDQLDTDPQQQIPSRRPRKGNVLIPEDLRAPPPRLALGISTSDGNKSASSAEPRYSEREMQLAVEAQKRVLLEAEKHAMEAHLSAKKLAYQIASYKTSTKTAMANLEEEEVLEDVGNIEIDNPLHMHERHFEDSTEASENESARHAQNEELSPEVVYTRCCHLREILPIPATLKQLKNKTSPLQILKMLNPKPTLIDVLSFTDFITIMPINTVIFDNVTMSTEMLKHVLSGLLHNKHLEKLSLRNVAIDELGWEYVCEFLERNHTVKKLDISQQRVKQVTKPTSFRSCMNWDLFINSLKRRNGIEELVLGGCKLSDETFENLLENALIIATCRLGVAATEINVRKCEMLADWIGRPNSKCVGIDIAYNDLSQGQLRPFIEAFNTKEVNLVFFSLNSTSLTDVDEVAELLRGLARLKNLRFFDFSSLPQLFPHVISKLGKHLPSFENLKRMHFDLNDLTSQSIAALADVFPKVPSLVHVSLLGNKNLDRGSIGALYTAVKSSSIFALDLDYDLVPDELSQRLALYLMKNFDKAVKPNIHDYAGETKQEDVMFDGSLLMETAEKMLTESDQQKGEVDVKLQKIITNALIERTNSVRKEMHRVIDTLFERRGKGSLSFEGKENLLRFCLLDASLEKLVHMFEQKAKMFANNTLSPSPSIKEHELSKTDSEREQLHAGSSALIATGPILMAASGANTGNTFQGNESTLQPHSVVIDAHSDGRNVIIDNLTGRPILMRSVSQTSLHAREQEEEEGEFLRWGYFMEHRENDEVLENTNSIANFAEDGRSEVSVFGAVPSGSELREAIMDAKGVESVTDLISKINNQRVSLDNIYHTRDPDASSTDADTEVKEREKERVSGSPSLNRNKADSFQDATEDFSSDDNASIDSSTGHDVNPVVDEAYDKLLNEAQRVMSNK